MHAERAIHRQNKVIKLIFGYDKELLVRIKAVIPSVRWSQSMRCWHVPDTPETLLAMRQLEVVVPDSVPATVPVLPQKSVLLKPAAKQPLKAGKNEALLQRFAGYMREQRYRARTVEGYTECLRIFFRFLQNKDFREISNADVDDFNQNYILKKHLSATYQSQFISALKLFYGKIPRKQLAVEQLERPRRGRPLPKVVAKEEIARMLGGIENLKHRAMLSLIYSCGLRRNELLGMHIVDIDSKRHLVNVRRGKGDKDRQVPLSPKILELLRSYFRQYRPQTYLFEGDKPGAPYTGESLHRVFVAAKQRAGITVPIKLHGLRHCYATHLMEAGVGIRYIQELLGHSHLKTTEIYTHVSTDAIQQIQSPFDSLDI